MTHHPPTTETSASTRDTTPVAPTTHAALVSFGRWEDTFTERVDRLAANTGRVTIFRPPLRDRTLTHPDNVHVREVGPNRSVRYFLLYPFVFLVAYLHAYYREGERFHVLHSLDFYVGPVCALLATLVSPVAWVASFRGLPITVTDEYRDDARAARAYHRLVFRALLLGLYAVVLRRADELVFKSTSERDVLTDRCRVALGERAHVIPTGVDFETFSPDAVDDAHEATVDRLVSTGVDGETDADPAASDEFLVVCASRLSPAKGVVPLVRAHLETAVPGAHLLVVGDGTPAYVDQVREAAGGSDAVTVRPVRLPHEAMPALLRRADAVALLSTYNHEGAPKLLQEALAVGTPCIASDIPGIRAGFDGIAGCRFIDPADPQSYAAALRATMDDNAVDGATVRRRFDLRRNYARVAALYAHYGETNRKNH